VSSLVRAGLVLIRLGIGIGARLDLTGELRALGLDKPVGRELDVGSLVELGYTVADHLRFGAGYNLSRFSDDELGDLERDGHGPFARVSGTY
jgi:hypothetical protein